MSQLSVIGELEKEDLGNDLYGTCASFKFLTIWCIILSLIIPDGRD